MGDVGQVSGAMLAGCPEKVRDRLPPAALSPTGLSASRVYCDRPGGEVVDGDYEERALRHQGHDQRLAGHDGAEHLHPSACGMPRLVTTLTMWSRSQTIRRE